MSLRDVRFALDGDVAGWSLRDSLGRGVWPGLEGAGGRRVSLREVIRRFARPGAALRELAGETRNVWQKVDRGEVVRELRNRLRDPGVMRQNPTDLCGPYSVLMEFARRHPTRFVRGAAELLRAGVFTTQNGRTFVAEEDLRGRRVPGPVVAAAEWIYVATMRDSENVIDDVDAGIGLEGATWPFEMKEWTEDVLGLRAEYIPCWLGGELSAIRAGQRAVERGGVAFLLVDKNLVKSGEEEGEDDSEEEMWWRRRRHKPGEGLQGYGGWVHSEDDAIPPDHYVVLLGELRGAAEGGGAFGVLVWSFGYDYEIKGAADSFGEYLYAVITGVPNE